MSKIENVTQKPKRPRGRPRKVRTPEELAKMAKPKLTLAEKQAIKLKAQREKEAAKAAAGQSEPKNKQRFYCTNKELQAELIKWRDSNKDEEERLYNEWKKTHRTQKQKDADPFKIKYEDRKISEELGKIFIAISQKLLNHSNFRNYSKELKEDMQSFFYLKIIKGLKNYNFEFNNPFSFVTMAAINAYLTVIGQHYKHINTKKKLMQKLAAELNSFNGISPNTSLNKCIKSYLGNDVDLDN